MHPMSIKNSMDIVYKSIKNTAKEGKTQDPDEIKLHKQWSEFGVFKGYWIDVIYWGKRNGKEDNLVISFDITPHYTRCMGDIKRIPLFTPGKHNFPEPETKQKVIKVVKKSKPEKSL